jgi:hypothetical protein
MSLSAAQSASTTLVIRAARASRRAESAQTRTLLSWLMAWVRDLIANPLASEQPQHLHRTVARLGRGGGAPGQHGVGGGFGVDGAGPAVASAGGLVRLVDLRDLDPLGVRVAGQGRPVGAGALDAGTSQPSERAGPSDELTVSPRGRREAPAVRGGTGHGDDSRGVNVLVGVHAEQDLLSGVGRDVTRGSGLRNAGQVAFF